jgi:hypothetical protein
MSAFRQISLLSTTGKLFEKLRGLGIFLFTTASRKVLGPTQPPIQWVSEALTLGVERLGREAEHSSPSRSDVKKCVELYLHSPIRRHGVVLNLKKGSTGTILPIYFI